MELIRKNIVGSGKHKNNCSVIALAGFLDIDYDDAYKLAVRFFKFEESSGAKMSKTSLNLLILNYLNEQLNDYKDECWFEEDSNLKYKGSPTHIKKYKNKYGVNSISKIPDTPITLSMFLKSHTVGNYLVFSRGHVFNVKDGVVIGTNYEGKRTKVTRIFYKK